MTQAIYYYNIHFKVSPGRLTGLAMSSKQKNNKKQKQNSTEEIVESFKDDVVDNLDFSGETKTASEVTKAAFEEEKVA